MYGRAVQIWYQTTITGYTGHAAFTNKCCNPIRALAKYPASGREKNGSKVLWWSFRATIDHARFAVNACPYWTVTRNDCMHCIDVTQLKLLGLPLAWAMIEQAPTVHPRGWWQLVFWPTTRGQHFCLWITVRSFRRKCRDLLLSPSGHCLLSDVWLCFLHILFKQEREKEKKNICVTFL